MSRYLHFYLVKIEFLGFRFHGWQKQSDVKTVHEMVDKTLSFVFEHKDFKTMGGSRTDAMVSALDYSFQLFVNEPIENQQAFLDKLNSNFPLDIRALSVRSVDGNFNIYHSSIEKEYHYFFAHNQKPHPYSSPFLFTHPNKLDIDMMKKGARIFLGHHNFKAYCTQPKPGTNLDREILKSEITNNTEFSASFFPEQSFVFKVRSSGFVRNQVRLMMGHLLQVGSGKLELDSIENSLTTGERVHSLESTAPASGLHLANTLWENKA